MTYYARHLPHWQPAQRTIFVTWRLHGSLPAEIVERLARRKETAAGKYFLDVDRLLDRAAAGNFWLKDE